MTKLLLAAIGLVSLCLVACGGESEGAPDNQPQVTIESISAVSTATPIPTATLPAVLPTPIVVGIDGEVNSTSAAACNRPGVLEGAAVIWNSQNICIVRYLKVGVIQAEVPFAKTIDEYRKFKAIGDAAIKALIPNEACDVMWGTPSGLNDLREGSDLVVDGC